MFSKQLINFTEDHFKNVDINILKSTVVKEVRDTEIVIQKPNKELATIPYGLLVWATGNAPRPVVSDLVRLD